MWVISAKSSSFLWVKAIALISAIVLIYEYMFLMYD